VIVGQSSPTPGLVCCRPLALSSKMRTLMITSNTCSAPSTSEITLDQGPRRKPFRPNRSNNGSRPQGHRLASQRPPGIRPPGDARHASQNARNNYERYTTMAKDAARRGDDIEAENCYQHAEHYFRVMKEQGPRSE
jgi:Domain of unknown function (DUF4167)